MPPIGWQEMLIVAAVALIVIGPKDLPKFARIVGGIVSRIKEMARDFQYTLQEIEHETEIAKIKQQVNEQMQDVKSYNPLKDAQDDIESAFGPIDNLEPKSEKSAEKTETPDPVTPEPAPEPASEKAEATSPPAKPETSDKPAVKKAAAKKTTAKAKTAAKPKAAAKKTTAKKTATKTRAKAKAKAPATGSAEA